MIKRKTTTQIVKFTDVWDLVDKQTPTEIIEKMQAINKEFAGRDIRFRVETYDCGDVELVETLLESDQEYHERLRKHKLKLQKEREKRIADQKAKEAADYALYVSLKAKFENQVK